VSATAVPPATVKCPPPLNSPNESSPQIKFRGTLSSHLPDDWPLFPVVRHARIARSDFPPRNENVITDIKKLMKSNLGSNTIDHPKTGRDARQVVFSVASPARDILHESHKVRLSGRAGESAQSVGDHPTWRGPAKLAEGNCAARGFHLRSRSGSGRKSFKEGSRAVRGLTYRSAREREAGPKLQSCLPNNSAEVSN
jgi:hypothetical protein